MRSFLGLAGYYWKYIPNYAALAAPLTDLTKDREPSKVSWGEAQEKAFTVLKEKLTSDPILKLPDFSRIFIVRTDASEVGIGAVLMQQEDEQYFPISFASWKLLPRQRSYAVIEKECLAFVWAVKKYQTYLYGREFVLQTDHEPLAYINKSKVANDRVMRWALFLQSFRFRIEAIKGSLNIGADYMSRSSV